jgi:hypothetical protein
MLSKKSKLKSGKSPWPLFVNSADVYTGFTDAQLEALVSQDHGYFEYFPKLVPVVFRETEKYGLGATYREWLDWPWFVPLPIRSDHGVQLQRKYSPDEYNSQARTYLTWSKWRATNSFNPNVTLQVPHPWVTYRKRNNLFKEQSAQGTLVFISHTMEDTERVFNFEKYFFDLISNLPSQFQPITLCIQANDVAKGLHKYLRKFGHPIVTVGNAESPKFASRFYDIVLKFNYATSNVIGSQLFYCEESGISYFLAGDDNQEVYKGEIVSWNANNDEDLVQRTHSLFSKDAIGASEEKNEFLSDVLGLEIEPESLKSKIRQRLFRDLFIMSPIIIARVFFNYALFLKAKIIRAPSLWINK